DQQQLCVHDASATRCNHETEVSRGSPQGSIPGVPIAATQNAFGTALTRESKEEEIFMKTKRLFFISCLAAGALIASPSFGKPAKKSASMSQSKARVAPHTTQVMRNDRHNQSINRVGAMGSSTRYYGGARYTGTRSYAVRQYSGTPYYGGTRYYGNHYGGGTGYYYGGGSYPYY